MKKIIATLIILLSFGNMAMAQKDTLPQVQKDSIVQLEEISVVAVKKKKFETEMKMAVSVDEYLASSDNISFIKRGAYAWEPLLNNMSTERSVITIDGMHIFGACTDKMDPVTSYVESNNLSAIDIKSGQKGSMHGTTVAGSIDLKKKSTPFGLTKKFSGSYQSGFELNNNQFFNLGSLSYSDKKWAADGSISIRDAGNYSDGHNDRVAHSQYNKFNASLGLSYKTGPFSSLKADAIFDRAKDVGYPALPMDLWLSRALITSLTYKQLFEEGLVRALDTRIYYNAVEHYMDDTGRPENLVHMDMPGWSTTYGIISKASLKGSGYTSEVQLNAYNNLSIAEMTMYPQDRSKKTMFAYSWPWVTTRFLSLAIYNSFDITDRGTVHLGGTLGWNYNYVKYAEFNHIFYPDAPQEKNRILPGLTASYDLNIKKFNFSVGMGYGRRAPSVSEGYGYYIYNSFDRYDYIGNPNLRSETSYEVNANAGFKSGKATISVQANYFHIRNYIVGKILDLGSPMNYQSVGVKGYTSLPYARLFNLSLRTGYDILKHLHWKGGLVYARAADNEGGNLPFIRPLSYTTSLHYMYRKFAVQTSLGGDFVQNRYSPEYGEDKTPAYMLWHISADYSFSFKAVKTTIQAGVENLLNRYYSTYADWGNIPRMGRNVFTSIKFDF